VASKCKHREDAYEKKKIPQSRCIATGPCQSIAENKLIVCRTTGRPLIFPNVIEGVCALFENSGKKKRKIQNDEGNRGGGEKRMKKENEDERCRGEKTKKTLTMQLWAHEEKENEWTTCSGGVLLAGFRGVEISYNVRDVCVDSFNSLPSRGGVIASLSRSINT